MIRKKTGSSRAEKRTAYGKRTAFGKAESFKSDRPEKSYSYGKNDSRQTEGPRKRTSFGKSDEYRSSRPEKMVTFGDKEEKRGSKFKTAPDARKSGKVGTSRHLSVSKVRKHEAVEGRGRHEEKQHDVIYGVNPVLEAFKAGRGIEKLILAEGRGGREIEEIINLARKRNIKLLFEPREALTRLSRTEGHQGVLAMASAGKYTSLDEILKKAEGSGGTPFVLILDGIQDPQNLGAIIRSAVCAGVHGIIIPKDRAVGLTSTVDKASAGAMEYMPVTKVTNIANTLDELKEVGFWIIGTEGKAKTNLYTVDLKVPVGLVIGSEGEGMRPLVAKKCDMLVSIPMKGKIGSLNASAAAAVVMYEVVRQRM